MSSQTVMIKEMISRCQEIRELLVNDQQHFGKNDLDALEASNKKKGEMLDYLNYLARDFNQVNDINGMSTPELQNLIENLKTEIATCYESIVINNQVVYANMQQIKEVWDKLLTRKESDVYEKNGVLEK